MRLEKGGAYFALAVETVSTGGGVSPLSRESNKCVASPLSEIQRYKPRWNGFSA